MNSIRNRFLFGLGIAALLSCFALLIVVINRYHLLAADLLTSEFALLEINQHVVIPMVVFIALFTLGAFIVIRDVERVLQKAADEVRDAATMLRAYKGPVEALPSEIRPLVSAFNELTFQLENHSRRQQAFAADAAHELKTPLAVMALEIDKLPAQNRQRLRDQIKGLSDMVDQLLLLARSNSRHTGAAGPLIDPETIGRNIVEMLAPTAIDDGVTLSYENANPAPFHGLEEAVSAAVRTLVVNAIRVTPEGGSITVRSGPGASIAVLDDGPSLDEAALEKLKARGVRGDTAEAGSAGLGLAIADRIAEAHGGELLTCSPEATGLKLVFPERTAA